MGFGNGRGLLLWVTCHLLLLPHLAHCSCPQSFPCGNFTFKFPFTHIQYPECGLYPVDGCSDSHPTVQIGSGPIQTQLSLTILRNMSENRFLVHDSTLQYWLDSRSCFSLFSNISLPNSPSVSFTVSFSPNLTFLNCPIEAHTPHQGFQKQKCNLFNIPNIVYYKTQDPASNTPDGYCTVVQLPCKLDPCSGNHTSLFDVLTATYTVEWHVSEACSNCYHGGGHCLTDNRNHSFLCKQEANPRVSSRLKLILFLSIPAPGLLLLSSIAYVIWLRKKTSIRGYLLSRNISSHPTSKSDIEGGILCFGIPVYSYTELEEATNNFDPSNELGDGGFGTVYYGKLRDGREVAIKRLYQHNFKRVEQFLNEIKILTSLRHPNLVSLYGCTSRTSRELLLVYEYISNGTVADHLHGDRADEAPLSWPVRLNIAIETATALAYLHISDIIHRDVKTNNILLDSNFSVKVADFGLSRLFPDNVTHISTAPQGTPGYVDPEYHQCYQLTDKSDVYSFGVVLIELISSMPAVDVSRHRDEVNLANLAMNRIQGGAFDELIDLSLGYDSDPEVTRMTTMVAELAFRCLQVDKDLRPSMNEVLTFLKDIGGSEDCNVDQIKEGNGYHRTIHPSPESCSASASNTTTSSV